jgi:hypothetical protein
MLRLSWTRDSNGVPQAEWIDSDYDDRETPSRKLDAGTGGQRSWTPSRRQIRVAGLLLCLVVALTACSKEHSQPASPGNPCPAATGVGASLPGQLDDDISYQELVPFLVAG